MRAHSLLLVVFAVACGSVRDRAECATSPECPAGQYCARTQDGNVCWPDAIPPTVSAVTVACDSTPCLRSGVLHVTATIADDAEVLGAEVALDLGGPAVSLTRSGATWVADLPLRRFPFEYFVHGVVATVTARDGARNEASVDASPATTVTRLRFEKVLEDGVELTSPVVVADESVAGAVTIAVAGANHRAYFIGWDGNGLASVAVGSLKITAAPLALGTSVWIGSEDNKVYEVTKNGSTWEALSRANTGGRVMGSLSLTSSGYVIAASQSGVVYAITSFDSKNGTVGSSFFLGPVIDESDGIFAVAGGAVRRMVLTAGIPVDSWGAPVALGGTVVDPLACTTVLVAAANNGIAGLVKRVDAAADPVHVATTAMPSSGVAILSDGSIIVPEQSRSLSRWTTSGESFSAWQTPDLGGDARIPIVLAATAPFVVSTGNGYLHALRADGTIAWSGKLSAGTASLQPGNIYTPPDQPADEVLSTAYFAGADGVLHAVIVDGALDGAAPWPKAFHDPRNTNRAGPQP